MIKFSKISSWLWQNRKVLITVVLSYGLLQGLFYVPSFLGLWIVLLLAVMTLGVWWVSSFKRGWQLWIWLLAEIIWVVAGGLGFVIFNLLNPWLFQIAAVAIAAVMLWLLMLYEKYLEDDAWPVWSFSLLDFLDLMAFFLVSSSLLLAGDLFNLKLGWLLVMLPAQVLLAVALRFWREKITNRRQWFYSILTMLVVQEIVWVMSFWHRGVFLKAFLVSLVFYLFADFIVHYIKGTLTVRVAVEYLAMVVILMAIIFIVDGLFVL